MSKKALRIGGGKGRKGKEGNGKELIIINEHRWAASDQRHGIV